jgi:uncharacterized protein YrrD
MATPWCERCIAKLAGFGGDDMLHLADKIRGATIRATDGDIGTLKDFYFEEGRWTIRYLLVDTGTWMSGKKVLLSPMSVAGNWDMAGIPVNLSKHQVWSSPEFDPQSSLTRDSETQVLEHYGYPYYWGAAGIWGSFDNPAALLAAPPLDTSGRATVENEPEHLRSIARSTGYHVQATDGEIGHVDDFLIGQESWRIRYLLVDTSNWIGGRSVIVSSDTLQSVNGQHGALRVGVSRDAIKHAPAYESIESALDARETGPPFTII